MYLLYGFQAE